MQTTRGSASYEMASFGTHRLSLAGRAYSEDLQGLARLNAFLERSDNDFLMEAEVFDDSGAVSKETVRRFHDGYRGRGAALGAGLMRRPLGDFGSSAVLTSIVLL